MERIYISTYYLKTFHYLFFSLGVFSLTAGIMFFDPESLGSFSLFGLTVFYCASSLMVARYFYKNYREIIEPFRVIRIYFLPYLLLVLWTIGSVTLLVWTFPVIASLIYSLLFINYYIFFVIVIGFAASRLKMVSMLFQTYNLYILTRAKSLARRHSMIDDVNDYAVGSDSEIDGMLDEIWAHKKYPLPHVRRFEIALCDRHVIEINRMMEKLRGQPGEKQKRLLESLEKMKDDYLQKIREIEQKTD